MLIPCVECGCLYNDDMPSCPECYTPTTVNRASVVSNATRFVNQTGLTNCPNCGAPVTNNIACEYCESAFPSVVKAPETVIINNDNYVEENCGPGVGTGVAAFLGGVLGGILGD